MADTYHDDLLKWLRLIMMTTSMRNFQSLRTLFLVKPVLPSTTTVRQPSSWASMAVLQKFSLECTKPDGESLCLRAFVCVYLYIPLPVPLYMSVRLGVFTPGYLCVCDFCASACLWVCASVSLRVSVCFCVSMFVCVIVCPFVSICLSVYLSLYACLCSYISVSVVCETTLLKRRIRWKSGQGSS